MEGRVLAGRYRLLAKFGQGAMGSVFRAEHLALRSEVAVKVLAASLVDSPDALARFEREALAVASLRSTHIVQVIDYGVDDKTPYIVMELLHGEDLGAKLKRVGRLSLEETVQILTQVARALSVAHNRGIVHRDLKPDNIFITTEGEDALVKVLDFGVAKRLDSFANSAGIRTQSGELLGTPYYMSPEQALGEPDIDHRTDIWSLGIILYECLVGKLPYSKASLGAVLAEVCHDGPRRPSEDVVVPPELDRWFDTATARAKECRFETAAQAGNALAAVVEAQHDAVRLSSQPEVAARTLTLQGEESLNGSSVAPLSATQHRSKTHRIGFALLASSVTVLVVLVSAYVMTRSTAGLRTEGAELDGKRSKAYGAVSTSSAPLQVDAKESHAVEKPGMLLVSPVATDAPSPQLPSAEARPPSPVNALGSASPSANPPKRKSPSGTRATDTNSPEPHKPHNKNFAGF